MGIRFLCPACGKRVNVKQEQAGLRGFCPKCGAGIDVPTESTLASRKEQDQEASTMAVAKAARANAEAATRPVVDPLREFPDALWYALPPGAPKPYGPIDGTGMAQWFYENRLSPDSMVWRQDWPEWRAVAEVWPNWKPNGAGLGLGHEPNVDPPPDGGAYPLKAVKAQSVARPPVISQVGGAAATHKAGLAGKPVAVPIGGAGKAGLAVAVPVGAAPVGAGAAGASRAALPGTVPVPIGTTVPGAGVYYRRRANRAYLTTVVALVLTVVALGGVMIWVLMRGPTPTTKPDDSSAKSTSSPATPAVATKPAPTTKPVATTSGTAAGS